MSVTTEPETKEGGWGETIKVIVQALILAVLVRTFLYQPFNIPSGSMKSTLLVGDYLFVSKFSYGYSRFSLPWVFSEVPVHGRVLGSQPKRGDVVVFRQPNNTDVDFIKRVIGLPGDRIQTKHGVLYINGTAVKKEPVDAFVEQDRFGGEMKTRRYRETLPEGRSYLVLDAIEEGPGDNCPRPRASASLNDCVALNGPGSDGTEYVVPEGHYFMMGDNRDNSQDSRFPPVGYVPAENLVGRAEIIFFSIEEGAQAWQFWTWPWTIRWSRMLDTL